MAIAYSGVNYAKTQALPITQIDNGQQGGIVKHILDQFVLTADLAANDTIDVGGPIPEGATVLDCIISSAAMGGSAAINVGWRAGAVALSGALAAEAAAPTALFSALPVSSAVVAKAHGSTYEGAFYTQVPLTSQVQPVITCSVASSGATGRSIMIDIMFVKNGG